MNQMGGSVLIVILLLTGCQPRDEQKSPAPLPEKPTIAVSNYPLQYMAERIGSPLVEIVFPAGLSGDPAYWKPSAEEVAALQKADLILLNGASYEQWLKGVSLPSSRVVETAAGFEDEWIALPGTVSHSHGPEGKHEHGEIAFTTWLDLSLALKQAGAVRDALTAHWPEHASLFRDNAAKLERDFTVLDRELFQIGQRAGKLSVVFSHPVYQYLERRYGLKGESLHWEPDAAPGEEMWNEMASVKKRTRARVVIWEGEPPPEVRARLTTMGLSSVVFDPCGNTPSTGDFLSIMRGNVASLDSAFGH